ncbi:MAG: hypothetical protein LC122_13070 [Chitinophagales bacterium]|nr:hypothetical protein [Chitinophagales bacterium]
MSNIYIQGTSNILNVNSDNELGIALQNDKNLAGNISMLSEQDDGSILRISRSKIKSSTDRKLHVDKETILANEIFSGTSYNTHFWYGLSTAMAITAGNGFLTLNANSNIANNSSARFNSYQHFPINSSSNIYLETNLLFTSFPLSGNVCEWGFGIAAGVTAPTDGILFRISASGDLRPFFIYDGSEIQGNIIDFKKHVGVGQLTNFIIAINKKSCKFWINDALASEIILPRSAAFFTSTYALPILFRTYNIGVLTTPQSIKISSVNVSTGNMNFEKDWKHQSSGMLRHSSTIQPGTISRQTAQWANSANPTAAAPTNSSAALGSGLGGIFIANVSGLAAGTDYIISPYQVPVGTSSLPGRTLYITGLNISTVNAGAANGAGGSTTWVVTASHNSTTLALSAGDSPAQKAGRKIPLGTQSIPANAPIGAVATNSIYKNFESPLVISQGSYIVIFIRFIAVNTQVDQTLNFYIGFDGYFE